MIPARVQAEAAWRARHKWAAQRVGRLLGDAHDRPPLGPLLDVAETLSLGIALRAPVPGAAGAAVEFADFFGWGASGGGCRCELWGSAAVGKRAPPIEKPLLPTPDVLRPTSAVGGSVVGVAVIGRPAALASPQVWDVGAHAWVSIDTPAGRRAAAAAAAGAETVGGGGSRPAAATGDSPAGVAAAAAAGAASVGGGGGGGGGGGVSHMVEGLQTSGLPTLRTQAHIPAHHASLLVLCLLSSFAPCHRSFVTALHAVRTPLTQHKR